MILTATGLRGQNLSTEGDDFWLAFLENWLQDENNPIILEIYISADDSSDVHIEMPYFQDRFSPIDTVVLPEQTIRIEVPTEIGMTQGTHTLQRKGIHITASKEVSVYAMNKRQWSADMAVILPTYTLGNEYMVISHWEDGNRNNNDNSDSEFLVLGVEDDTEIEIVPSHTTEGGDPPGTPFRIRLDAGEVYQVQARGDLTGTRIYAVANSGSECKKFAVFAGNQYTKVGECDNPNGHDHLFAQMYPTYTWGKDYITVDFKTRLNGDHVKVISLEDEARIFLNGDFVNTLSSGEFLFLKQLEGINHISSDKPISVAQFSRSQACDNTTGDPFILLINPNEQVLPKITFYAPTIATIQNYNLSIVARTRDVSTVVLDDRDISGLFDPVPALPEYSYAKVSVYSGNHTLSSDEGIIAYVYGYGSNESFGYPTGAGLTNLNLDIGVLDASGEAIPVDSLCHNTGVWFKPDTEFEFTRFHWDFGDGTEMITDNSDSVYHVYTRAGRYIVELTATSTASGCVAGAEQTSVKVIRVLNPAVGINGPRSVCPNTRDVAYGVSGDRGYQLFWEVSGGNLSIDSGTRAPLVDWGESNPDASLKVVPVDNRGCVGDTVTKPVRIKVQLEPEAPFGPDSLCFDPETPVDYSAYNVPGTRYLWDVDQGMVIGGQETNQAGIVFENPGWHQLWFEQISMTDTVCEGISDTLSVYLQRQPSSEARILADKPIYGINEEIMLRLETDSLYQLASWGFGPSGQLDSVPVSQAPMIRFPCQGTYLISVQALDTMGLCEMTARAELPIEVSGPELEIIRVSHIQDVPNQLAIEGLLKASTAYQKPVNLYRDGLRLDTAFIDPDIQFLDTALLTAEQSYRYELITNQDCPEMVRSVKHRSIRLEAGLLEGSESEALIRWNEYEGWEQDVDHYEIWLSVDEGPFTMLQETGHGEIPFRNEDLGFEHCFKAKAIESGGNQAHSWSNIACVTFVPSLYPYNIITPNGDGLNETFVIENIEHYPNAVLTIFNRWGKEIYQTRGYANNWSGMYQGTELPNSVYYYALEVNEPRYPLKTIQGTISILK